MKKILLVIIFIFPSTCLSLEADTGVTGMVKMAQSPVNRVVLLELYTSEGCSSCPPADRFLSSLKTAGVSDKQLIPMAFHVTYWDYIGWKDRFAKKQYDERQRQLAHKSRKSTVYTPQFVLSGGDYRGYTTFSEDVNKLAAEKATVEMLLSAHLVTDSMGMDSLQLNLETDITLSAVSDVGLYLAVIENNLVSEVEDGENDGEKLHHDYVVRQLLGPYFQSQPENQQTQKQTIVLQPDWKREDLSIIAFAENPHTGEVLQAVRLEY